MEAGPSLPGFVACILRQVTTSPCLSFPIHKQGWRMVPTSRVILRITHVNTHKDLTSMSGTKKLPILLRVASLSSVLGELGRIQCGQMGDTQIRAGRWEAEA